MGNDNDNESKCEDKDPTNDILNDIMENVVNPKQSSDAPSSAKSISESMQKKSINNKLSLISFEELRFKHYMDSKKWMESNKEYKIMILNWPNSMNKEALNTIFSSQGKILNCDVLEKFAFVQYEKYDSAQCAIQKFDGFMLGN